MTKPDVQHAIEVRLAERAEKPGLTAERVINGLLREAEAQGEGTSHGARVQAWGLLARHLGLFEKDNDQAKAKGMALDIDIVDVRAGARARAEELMQRLIVIEAERGDGA